MARTAYPFDIISADSHFTEPADLWLRHIDPEYRDRAPHVEHEADTDVFVCDGGEMFSVGLIHGVRYEGGNVPLEGRYADPAANVGQWCSLAIDAAGNMATCHFTVTVVPNLTVTITPSNSGTAIMTLTASAGASYAWTGPDVSIPRLLP